MCYYSRTDITMRIYIVLQWWKCNDTLLTEVFRGTLVSEASSFWLYEMYAKIFTCQQPLNTDVGELKIATGSQE